ncbi:MAG: MBL fold metallo-hydrolase [Lentisphaerae bacterium]|nr:MBL fold metallo-hydrolase [Lentisphaerota bacterium]
MKKLLTTILAALALAGGIWLGTNQEKPLEVRGPSMEIHFIDVGQGDSLLIQSPDGKSMLVDAGEKRAGDKVVQYLRSQRITRLDILAMSHPHSDHIGGMEAVLSNFSVGRVLDSGYPHGSKVQLRVLEQIENDRIPYIVAHEGQRFQLGNDVIIEILSPPQELFKNTTSDANNNSLVMRVTYGEISALLTGDLEREGEATLIASRQNLESCILKVAHHGSRNSTSIELLRMVKPGFAVISVGANNEYGHPHKALLKRLSPERLGAKVYRTDRNGTIVLNTDGKAVYVRTEK